MTVSTTPYFSWSGSGIDHRRPPYTSCSPNLVSQLAYLRRRWGGASLGCHVDPPSSTKSHPYGAALDWSWLEAKGGPGRARCAGEVIPFLIANSAELGVNTIHDYFQRRMWKSTGWVENAPIGDWGGTWLHIETTPAAFSDGRPVEDRLSGTPDEIPGGDFMSPEDKAYIDAKFAEVLGFLRSPEYVNIVVGSGFEVARSDEFQGHVAAGCHDATAEQLGQLATVNEQILAALNGAEFPVSGTVHIGTT